MSSEVEPALPLLELLFLILCSVENKTIGQWKNFEVFSGHGGNSYVDVRKEWATPHRWCGCGFFHLLSSLFTHQGAPVFQWKTVHSQGNDESSTPGYLIDWNDEPYLGWLIIQVFYERIKHVPNPTHACIHPCPSIMVLEPVFITSSARSMLHYTETWGWEVWLSVGTHILYHGVSPLSSVMVVFTVGL